MFLAQPDVEVHRVFVFIDDEEAAKMPIRDGRDLKAGWTALQVRPFDEKGGSKKPIADISGMVGLPLFSAHAYDATRGVLEKCGQFLPFRCGRETLWGFNVTKIVDCLDEEKSTVTRFRTGRVMDISRYTFKPMIADLGVCVFGIPQLGGSRYYATEGMKRFFEDEGITGMSFTPL